MGAVITLTCKRCGLSFETRATTNTRCRSCKTVVQVPAAARLSNGSGRSDIERPQPLGQAPPKRPATPERPTTVVSAASAIVHEGEPTTEAARKRPPTAKEWSDKAALALALLTTWFMLRLIARSDLANAPDEVQDGFADHLEMGEDEVEAVVDPFIALITGPLGSMNKRYGRASLEILGVLPASLAFVTWHSRVQDFERQHCPPKQRRERPSAPQPVGANGEEVFVPRIWNGSTVFEPDTIGLVGPQSA
jgi:hypothetical protein